MTRGNYKEYPYREFFFSYPLAILPKCAQFKDFPISAFDGFYPLSLLSFEKDKLLNAALLHPRDLVQVRKLPSLFEVFH